MWGGGSTCKPQKGLLKVGLTAEHVLGPALSLVLRMHLPPDKAPNPGKFSDGSVMNAASGVPGVAMPLHEISWTQGQEDVGGGGTVVILERPSPKRGR